MRRFLIVANQTLGGDHIIDEMQRRIAEGPCAFYVVVPATLPQDHLVATDGQARALARARLDRALERFSRLDADVTGEVGDERPLDAIVDALLGDHYDGIILSTLPAGLSRWLWMDLPSRVERQFDLPVTHIIAEPEPVTAAARR
ncbi:MAG: hypothetical protein KY462_10215 [Actinobacteria bacterium]|nr:hypothetical protein [Actinomycetota bacterium]